MDKKIKSILENVTVSITSFIKGLFGSNEAGDGSVKNEAGKTGNERIATLNDLEDFVNYVVTALVDYPDDVKVTTKKNENNETVIWIACRQEDKGKIIGKKGKTIIALRSLVSGAAGRMQNRVKVEVED